MGFDNDCIVNIQSLNGEYFCPVCRTLVNPNEALQTKCTHLYCKPCLAQVVSTIRACPYDGCLVAEGDGKPLIESNKTLAETLGKILVHCLYHRSGCHWQGPFFDCSTHSSACPFGNCVVACSRCTVHIVHREIQEHLQTCTGLNPQAKPVTDPTQAQTQAQTAQTTQTETETETQTQSQAQTQTQTQTQIQTRTQIQTQTQIATQSVAPAQLPAGAVTVTQPQPARPATQLSREQSLLLLQQQRQYQIYQQLHLQQQQQILLLQAQHIQQILPRQQIPTRPQGPQPRASYNSRNQTHTNHLRPTQYRQPVLPQVPPAHQPSSFPQLLPHQQVIQSLPPPPPSQQPKHTSGTQFPPPPPPPPQQLNHISGTQFPPLPPPQQPNHVSGTQFPPPPPQQPNHISGTQFPPPAAPQQPNYISGTQFPPPPPAPQQPNHISGTQFPPPPLAPQEPNNISGTQFPPPPLAPQQQNHMSSTQFLLPPPPPAQTTQPQSHTFVPSQGHQQIQQRPVRQNIPQHVPPQKFLGQSGQVQIQLHQQNQFVPPGPPKNYPAHLQPQAPHQFQHFLQLPGQRSQQFVQSGLFATTLKQEHDAVSQYTSGNIEISVVDENALRMKRLIQEHGSEPGKALIKDDYIEVNAVKVDSSEPVLKIAVKEEGNLVASDSVTVEIPASEEAKNAVDSPNDSSLPVKDSADVNMTEAPYNASLQGKDLESSLVTNEQEKTDGQEIQCGRQSLVNPAGIDVIHNHTAHKSDTEHKSDSDSHSSLKQHVGNSAEHLIDGEPDLLKEKTQKLDMEEIHEHSGNIPRNSLLDSPKFGSYLSSSRTTDKAHSKLEVEKSPSGSSNYDDARFKTEFGYSEEAPSRLLPLTSSFDQDFRTLVREHGTTPLEYGQEQNLFSEESRSIYNLPKDQPGSSSNGNRFSHFSGNSQKDDHFASELTLQDKVNHHLSGKLFSEPRLGEPGFRSKYTVNVFPSEGGSNLGETSALDQLRKRRLASIVWWCRICGMDCETEEGLDYHFQDKDHQKMAMDVVLQIKQENVKKQKISNDHPRADANKSIITPFDSRPSWS